MTDPFKGVSRHAARVATKIVNDGRFAVLSHQVELKFYDDTRFYVSRGRGCCRRKVEIAKLPPDHRQRVINFGKKQGYDDPIFKDIILINHAVENVVLVSIALLALSYVVNELMYFLEE